jgi:hypothetical protein
VLSFIVIGVVFWRLGGRTRSEQAPAAAPEA